MAAEGVEELGGECAQSYDDHSRSRTRVAFRDRWEPVMKVPYTFSVIRYVHDPIAGESLNVGVLLFSGEAAILDVMLEYRYERSSATFARFDGERFKQVLCYFEAAVTSASDQNSV